MPDTALPDTALPDTALPDTALPTPAARDEVLAAVPTLFDEAGEIDHVATAGHYAALRGRVDGIFVARTTGEFPALDRAERRALAEAALQVFGPDHVVVHVGAASTRDTVAITRDAVALGAVTEWLRTIMGSLDHAALLPEAEAAGPGARGLLMLPYFSGERTPIADPDARGVIAGLTVEHTRGDLYRAAVEATAFGVRHNVEAMRAAGADIQRVIAVGGGTKATLWTQIVSDVTGLEQHVPTVTIGASYGAAYLAAQSIGGPDFPHPPDIANWNPARERRMPVPAVAARYDRLFDLYRQLYPATGRSAMPWPDPNPRTDYGGVTAHGDEPASQPPWRGFGHPTPWSNAGYLRAGTARLMVLISGGGSGLVDGGCVSDGGCRLLVGRLPSVDRRLSQPWRSPSTGRPAAGP